jgi:hypothetical protein
MNGNIWLQDRTPSPEKRAACGDPAVGAARPFAKALLVGLLLALLAMNVAPSSIRSPSRCEARDRVPMFASLGQL